MCIGIIMNMNNLGISFAYLVPGMIMDNLYGFELLSSVSEGRPQLGSTPRTPSGVSKRPPHRPRPTHHSFLRFFWWPQFA